MFHFQSQIPPKKSWGCSLPFIVCRGEDSPYLQSESVLVTNRNLGRLPGSSSLVQPPGPLASQPNSVPVDLNRRYCFHRQPGMEDAPVCSGQQGSSENHSDPVSTTDLTSSFLQKHGDTSFAAFSVPFATWKRSLWGLAPYFIQVLENWVGSQTLFCFPPWNVRY